MESVYSRCNNTGGMFLIAAIVRVSASTNDCCDPHGKFYQNGSHCGYCITLKE